MWYVIIFILFVIIFIFYDTSYKVDKSLKNIDLKKAKNLMIVAHPDDETLWGGAHLLVGNYLVVCVTGGTSRVRIREFKKVMMKTNNQYVFLKYPDLTCKGVSKWHKEWPFITADLKKIITSKKWDNIVTHNNIGEYGHIHHRLTSKIVTIIIKSLKIDSNFYYFGDYYKKGQIKENRISQESLEKKIELMKNYHSQFPVRWMHKHMYPYENWKKVN